MTGGRESGVLRAALADVAEIGPFFAASANPAEVVDDSWRPLRELYTDPEPLATRIQQVAEALGLNDSVADRRIAGSIAYQGLAARLVSPVLAVASVHRLVPAWSPDSLHWRHAVSGPWPLWEAAESAEHAERIERTEHTESAGYDQSAGPGGREDSAALAKAVAQALVEPHLEALAVAVRGAASVSPRILRGNAASAVVAAGRLVAQARPAAAGTARELVAGLLDTGPLGGAGVLGRGWSFRRRSCCLFYRVPGGGTCDDCVLAG